MKTITKIVTSLILGLILTACDAIDETSETNDDSFSNLDTPPTTDTEIQPHVKVENMFGEKIMLELWSGENIEYVPANHEVRAAFLKNVERLEIEPLSANTFTMTEPLNVLALVGVYFNGRYEYLTEEKFANLGNGAGLRIDAKGNLKPFDNNICTANLSSTEIMATTEIIQLIENTANDLSGQWDNIKAISNPLYTLLRFANDILVSNSPALVISELANWTASNGTYTHIETVNSTELTLTTQFLWGNGFGGHNADEVISDNLHDPANYFTGLSTSINNENITFNYTEAKSLAPLLGVPVDANAGSYQVNIIEWLERIRDNYKSIQWQMDLTADHNIAAERLQTTLNFTGRPSFNVSVDAINQKLDISQNPFTLKLASISDTSSNTGSSRGQDVFLKNWTLKVFPDDSGSKGVVEFDVKNDSNFDFSGFISYNSDPATNANIFIQCDKDESPIRY